MDRPADRAGPRDRARARTAGRRGEGGERRHRGRRAGARHAPGADGEPATELLPTEAPRTPAFTLPAGRTATVFRRGDRRAVQGGDRARAQATITGDAVSTVLSDDPSTGAPNDPTVTIVPCCRAPRARRRPLKAISTATGRATSWSIGRRTRPGTRAVRCKCSTARRAMPVPATQRRRHRRHRGISPVHGPVARSQSVHPDVGRPGRHLIPADYDHDGAANMAVYRPSTGQWFVRGQFVVQFGDATDIPDPGRLQRGRHGGCRGLSPGHRVFLRPQPVRDAVRRARVRAGRGRLRRQRDRGHRGVSAFRRDSGSCGISSSRSTGRPAMCRCRATSTATAMRTWRSTGHRRGIGWMRNQFDVGFGDPGDLPVPRGPQTGHALAGDFTSDRRTDVSVYRPSTGQWMVFGELTVQFGEATDVPVPADYTGDGRMDIAVYRPSTGQWFVRNVLAVTFGPANATPVPGDYNGDGLADVAVFVSATGEWQVRNQFTVTFGQAGDIPGARRLRRRRHHRPRGVSVRRPVNTSCATTLRARSASRATCRRRGTTTATGSSTRRCTGRPRARGSFADRRRWSSGPRRTWRSPVTTTGTVSPTSRVSAVDGRVARAPSADGGVRRPGRRSRRPDRPAKPVGGVRL